MGDVCLTHLTIFPSGFTHVGENVENSRGEWKKYLAIIFWLLLGHPRTFLVGSGNWVTACQGPDCKKGTLLGGKNKKKKLYFLFLLAQEISKHPLWKRTALCSYKHGPSEFLTAICLFSSVMKNPLPSSVNRARSSLVSQAVTFWVKQLMLLEQGSS